MVSKFRGAKYLQNKPKQVNSEKLRHEKSV
jgi:hypothetical protein